MEPPFCNFILKLYWNHTSAWVLSCKLAAYFQSTFSQEQLRVAASAASSYYWQLLLIPMLHCLKSVHIRSYSGPHFSAFGLNTYRHSVSLRIQSECGKMRTRITPNTDTFHAVPSSILPHITSRSRLNLS